MKKKLLTSRRYLQYRNQLIRPNSGSGRREWVISRGLCFYRCFDLSELPASQREQNLDLQIQQWSPFPETASYIVWKSTGKQVWVQVWIWNQQQQQEHQAEAGLKSITCLPESILRPPLLDAANNMDQGTTQILKTWEGLELQYWLNGVLRASHWYPQETVTPDNWFRFQRAQGLPCLTDLPAIKDSELLERPWGRARSGLRSFSGLLGQERLWVTMSAAILVMMLAWQLVAINRWQHAIIQVEQQNNNTNQQITPLLEARNQAIADRLRITKLLALNAYPSLIQLLSQVADKLPTKAKVLEWHYEPGKLNFSLVAKNLDPRFYVNTFQDIPGFSEVRAEVDAVGKKITLHMQVKAMDF